MIWRLIFGAVFLTGYLIHMVHCLLAGQWLFLLVGAIVFPAGMIHGYILMFGGAQ